MSGTRVWATMQNMVVEISLQSSVLYSDPFKNISLTVEVLKPDGGVLIIPAFWAGENIWRFRFSSSIPGNYRYKTVCSNSGDTGLHNITGAITVRKYNRESFLNWKKGFTKECFPERLPDNWDSKCTKWRERDNALLFPGLGQFGLYGLPRHFFGTEGISYVMYDDPLFFEEVLEFITEYLVEFLHYSLQDIVPDWFLYFEDMSYKNGPLISPEFVKKYFTKRYRRINDVLRNKGVKYFFVDGDGDVSKLIPLYLDSGINGVLPLEAAAGMNVVKLRNEYPELLMMGGIDKMRLIQGKKAIDEELEYKIGSIVDRGRYIPTVDHLIPPDISSITFCII